MGAHLPTPADPQAEVTASWADRCRHWLASPNDNARPKRNRRQTHEPLILTGHGMCLRVHHGALVVRNGFTHYPQAAEQHRFFRGDRNLPSRIIVLDGSGSLSFDVLSWLSEQNVPLIQVNWRGEVIVAVGMGHSIDPERVKAQLENSTKWACSTFRDFTHTREVLQRHRNAKRRGAAFARTCLGN